MIRFEGLGKKPLQATDVRLDAEHFKNLIAELTELSGWKPMELRTLANSFAVEEREIFKNKKEKTNTQSTDETSPVEDDAKIL